MKVFKLLGVNYADRGENLRFPINFDLKVIMVSRGDDEEKRNKLKALLERLSIPHREWRSKKSSKGNYISISINVTINSRYVFDSLYADLRKLEGIKFAI